MTGELSSITSVDRSLGLQVLLGPGLDHLHVEVDHLVVQPLKASKGQDVLDCDLDLVGHHMLVHVKVSKLGQAITPEPLELEKCVNSQTGGILV